MRNLLLELLLSIPLLLLVSYGCDDTNDPPPEDEIPYLKITDLDELEVTFTADQTSAVTVTVDTNVKDWKAAADGEQSWIEVKQNESSFDISVKEYTTEEAIENTYRTRNGTVRVSATGTEPINITVKQSPPKPVETDMTIYVNVTTLDFPMSGTEEEMTKIIEVTTNALNIKTLIPPTWLECEFVGKDLWVFAYDNLNEKSREYTIVFEADDAPNKPEVVVTQPGTGIKPEIKVNPTTLTFEAGTDLLQMLKIEKPLVRMMYVYVPEEYDWIHSAQPYYELADFEEYISDRNEIEVICKPYYDTEKDREGEIIVFSQIEGVERVTVKVIQKKAEAGEQPDLDLSGKWNFTGDFRLYEKKTPDRRTFEVELQFDPVIDGYLVWEIPDESEQDLTPIVISVDESGDQPVVYFEHGKLNGQEQTVGALTWLFANAISLLDLELDSQPYPNWSDPDNPGGLSEDERWVREIPGETRILLNLSDNNTKITAPSTYRYNAGGGEKDYGLALGWGINIGVNLNTYVKVLNVILEKVEE